MLNRLSDRIEAGPDGETIIKRYGLWGVSAEIEKRGRKFVVIQGKKEVKYKTLAEAENHLLLLLNR